jgi:hypothetical protein
VHSLSVCEYAAYYFRQFMQVPVDDTGQSMFRLATIVTPNILAELFPHGTLQEVILANIR